MRSQVIRRRHDEMTSGVKNNVMAAKSDVIRKLKPIQARVTSDDLRAEVSQAVTPEIQAAGDRQHSVFGRRKGSGVTQVAGNQWRRATSGHYLSTA